MHEKRTKIIETIMDSSYTANYQVYLIMVKLYRAQGGCLGTKSR